MIQFGKAEAPLQEIARGLAKNRSLRDGGRDFWTIHAAGAFGLSMLFVLNAYLITELLLR